MKKQPATPRIINSLSELHTLFGLPGPEHPLVSLIDFSEVKFNEENTKSLVLNFYSVAIKKGYKGKMKYGQSFYDFDEGVMSFMSPGQSLSKQNPGENPFTGWCLNFHPDFIANYPLGKRIKSYGFFSYAVNEALHLSEKEEAMVEAIMQNILLEYCSSIDKFSQDVMIAHIELLLSYSNRFYDRQFITRKSGSNDLLIKVEDLLTDYFNSAKVHESGLPTVQYISGMLNVSASYLSDMLRTITGQNTQQHIHNKIIEKAKEILTTTSLSVSEIAYQLGFEHPQSFNKLFKNKTNVSPRLFRQSFN